MIRDTDWNDASTSQDLRAKKKGLKQILLWSLCGNIGHLTSDFPCLVLEMCGINVDDVKSYCSWILVS